MDYTIEINVSEDKYIATITIVPLAEDIKIKKDDIINKLKEKQITYGIQKDVINNIVKDPYGIKDVVIAKGLEQIDGIDGKITYNFDFDKKLKPKINEDGSVDFKNLNYSITVNKGEVLASRTMPSEFKNGINVYGKEVPAKKGKIENFKIGKNVEVTPDDLKIIATKQGTLKKLNDGKIAVFDELVIDDNVGVETGNIDFNGKVIVNGNITSGYKVKCLGDLIVTGIVENASIDVDGDLIVQGGIQGKQDEFILVTGNITSKFINSANIECGGSIETDTILHSSIICKDKIILKGQKGILVGGNIKVNHYIEAKQIGTAMGTITNLELGNITEKNNKIKENDIKIKDIQQNIEKLLPTKEMLEPKIKVLDKKMQEEFKRLVMTIEHLNSNIERIKEQNSLIKQEIKLMKKAYVKSDKIYVGTNMNIVNIEYSPNSDLLRKIVKCVAMEIFMQDY